MEKIVYCFSLFLKKIKKIEKNKKIFKKV